RLAVRAGRTRSAARLRELGAAEDGTDVDRFLGACLNADRLAVRQQLADDPELPGRLTEQDRGVICEAAASYPVEALELMLESGFSARTRRLGELPLHAAAYHGNAVAVRILLDEGAEVDARDDRFAGTALAFATVGSGEQAAKPGDWITTVRLLIEAGATRDDVWITGKPPSEEVADLLLYHGITPCESAGSHPGIDDHEHEHKQAQATAPASLGTGVMAEIARHLEAAGRDLDLDVLGSLLHPEVRWTGLCRDRTQVLDWYRAVLAEGVEATVHSVEVDRDAVVLGLTVARRAVAARPAPPQQLYQVFTVAGDQIVEICGYPDRASALTRGGEPAEG
ncbi:MAG: ankyrin repeat domain-containing protein, partial [Actinocrinis sp.]